MNTKENDIETLLLLTITSNLSVLHWDNSCGKCPLINECTNTDKTCWDIWHDWLKSIIGD